MRTIKFEFVSDKFGIFNVDYLYSSNEQLYFYLTRHQYSQTMRKINERIEIFKCRRTLSYLVGVIIGLIVIIILVLLTININARIIVTSLTVYCVTCVHCTCQAEKVRFRKLQSDVRRIADKRLPTSYGMAYSQWTIEKIDNDGLGKKLKLTAEFTLHEQQREIPAAGSYVGEPIDWRSVRLDPPASALVLDLEQATTILDNEQHSTYEIAPTTPPPPSYDKVVVLFSQAVFGDCSKCGAQKCVFNAKYCVQCGHSLII